MTISLGSIIHKARSSQDLALRDLAELSGVSHSQLNKIERDLVPQPERSTIRRLAAALSIEEDFLLIKAGYVPETTRQTKNVPARDFKIDATLSSINNALKTLQALPSFRETMMDSKELASNARYLNEEEADIVFRIKHTMTDLNTLISKTPEAAS